MKESKWDWEKVERLVLGGTPARDIIAMPEFSGLNLRNLQNTCAKKGWTKKRKEIEQLAAAGMDKKLVDTRSAGVEEHHRFVFEQMSQMRSAIAEKAVKGNVKELREYLDMLQKYLDAAETSYGLKADQVKDESAVSLNAMVALHIVPPSRAAEGQVIEVQAISTSVEREMLESESGSESECDTVAEG